jgi:lipopolysaccharide biosynthesis glycosyltransferase
MTARTGGSSPVTVVSACDDAYAMPLAVTVRSALANFSPNRALQLYVLDGGLCDENRKRLLESWEDARLTVHFIRSDMKVVQGLTTSGHVNAVTYLRLLMPWLLPAEEKRAIYLDADLVVLQDLARLWDVDQAGMACLATQDIAAPFIDARIGLPSFDRCRHQLASITPVSNYRELGLSPEAKYFNGGVLVVDLDRWRAEGLAEQMLRCLHDHSHHVRWWDQYALNVVLADKWGQIDLGWNQNAHVYKYPSWHESPLDEEQFHELRDRPWIVHFCSPAKPWHYFSDHPYTETFRDYLKQTAWKDWQPSAPADYLRHWWKHQLSPYRRQLKSYVQRLREVVAPQRKNAA